LSAVGVPNLRHLRAVEAVARFGSVSQAAAHIHVSQPAVTQAIAKIESQLGTELFERRATGTYPTEAGKIILRRIERFFARLETAVAEFYRASGEPPQKRAVEQIITGTQIRSMIATADSIALAETARAMRVSVISLRRSVRELERALGCSLFTRTAAGLETTAAGAELARKCALAVREIEYGIEEVESARGRTAARLSIGVLPMSGSFAFGSAVNELMRLHRQAHIKIIDGTYLALLNSLRQGNIDVIFGLLRKPDWCDDIVEEALFDDSFCVVVRRDHPLTRLDKLTREDLARYEWIGPAPGTPRRREIEGIFAGMERPPRLGVETSSVAVTRAVLSGSDSITVLPRYEVDLEERLGLFAVLPFHLGYGNRKGVTTRADWLPTALYVEFIELLRKHTIRSVRAPNHLLVSRTGAGHPQSGSWGQRDLAQRRKASA
jgi:DNA-binding transcriptional LysR family regulator